MSQNFAQGQFQVGEINDHPVLGLAHDSEFNSIGVSMERPTFSVPGKEMRAVNVFGHTQLHYCENSLTRVGDGKPEARSQKPEWEPPSFWLLASSFPSPHIFPQLHNREFKFVTEGEERVGTEATQRAAPTL